MKKRLQGFVAGVLCCVLLAGIGVLAKNTTETIQAIYRDIKIYVDGVKIEPKDANGNTVEPFIYNGTTYLPVRAVGEAINKQVSWDGNTNSVYLGDIPKTNTTSTVSPNPNNYDKTAEEVATYYFNAYSIGDFEKASSYSIHYAKLVLESKEQWAIERREQLKNGFSQYPYRFSGIDNTIGDWPTDISYQEVCSKVGDIPRNKDISYNITIDVPNNAQFMEAHFSYGGNSISIGLIKIDNEWKVFGLVGLSKSNKI